MFELGEVAWDESRRARGLIDEVATPAQLAEAGRRERPLIEFMAAQPGGCFLVCEEATSSSATCVVARFATMDELAELWVAPEHRGPGREPGPARALLAGVAHARAWAGSWWPSARRPTSRSSRSSA